MYIQVSRLAVALWLGALLLTACQPVQPAAQSGTDTATSQASESQASVDAKIENATTAGPMSITSDAAVRDWPVEPDGEVVELRAGANGWVCRPDDPITPSNDPRCFHPAWLAIFGKEFGPDREAQTNLGVAYMLQGGNAADNDDPSVLVPAAGQEWQTDPPHLMVVSPTPWEQEGFTNDHHSGSPWIMFKDSPLEHMMIPIEIREAVASDDKIGNARSAGPASIADNAAVMDWPAEAGGELVELAAGSNGWTCLPDDPATPTDDPVCVDAVWLQWFEAVLAGNEPEVSSVGFAYMLQGGSVADNDDPSVMEPAAGAEWQIDPPHVMILSPSGWDPALYPHDMHAGPWIMFQGTPMEHLMFPVTDRDSDE